MHVFISTFGVNHIGFCMHFCLLFLSMMLFLYHFIPPFEVSEVIYCVFLICGSSFLHLQSFFSLTVWINLIAIQCLLPRYTLHFPSQSQSSYWKCFCFALLVSWGGSNDKICISHCNGIMSPIPNVKGNRSSSHARRELVNG